MGSENSTQADATVFSGNSGGSSSGERPVDAPQEVECSLDEGFVSIHRVQDRFYDMTGNKILVIFNHYQYQNTRYFNFHQPSKREYTEFDVASLTETFSKLGFLVIVHQDLSYTQILQEIRRVCDMDHRGTSCVAIAVMTHGDGGSLCASDRPYNLSDITRPLQHQPSLVGKPKLLFIQACRGTEMDGGQRVQTDGSEATIVLPTHADTVILLSSAENYVSYRASNGSWLMQALCDVLDEWHEELDLLHMIVLVNQKVASRAFTSSSEESNNKKMMPETKMTLTKLVKF